MRDQLCHLDYTVRACHVSPGAGGAADVTLVGLNVVGKASGPRTGYEGRVRQRAAHEVHFLGYRLY